MENNKGEGGVMPRELVINSSSLVEVAGNATTDDKCPMCKLSGFRQNPNS